MPFRPPRFLPCHPMTERDRFSAALVVKIYESRAHGTFRQTQPRTSALLLGAPNITDYNIVQPNATTFNRARRPRRSVWNLLKAICGS